MANLGIIGHGFVGKAVSNGFKEHKILIYDKFKKSTPLKKVVKNSEFIFICLPTPSSDEGIDLSIMDEMIEKISKLARNTEKILIIKSTILPGTTEKYIKKYPECNFCFNPEFLTEANYLDDFINTDRIVIGSKYKKINKRIYNLYRERFPKTKILLTHPTEAEMTKYMANTLLATKVIFANELHELCENLNINYNKVKEMVIADKRLGKTHLEVTQLKGFGGKCFPKDLIALISLYKSLDLDSSLLETVWNKNLRIRKKRDWESIPFAKT